MNLKEIIFRRDLYGTRDAFVCVRGPKYVIGQDIISPPSVKIVYTTQHIVSITEPNNFCIGLEIERTCGYHTSTPNQDASYPLDVVSMPIRNANSSIQCYGNENEKRERLFLEIWTNGSLTPKEALYKASRNLIDFFIPFLHAVERDINLDDDQNIFTVPFFPFHEGSTDIGESKKRFALKRIFIDQF
ncbi:hypothetical protein AMTRI_Chr07g27840 [Amborella trichopoda]